MEKYFNINYEFDVSEVHRAIEKRLKQHGSDYICVSDGLILNTVHEDLEYRKVVNGGMFSISDSSFVPVYIRWIYGKGKDYHQYCGSEIFEDIVKSRKYRMFFMGATQEALDGMKKTIYSWNPDTANMTFYELPFKKVDEFDYQAIANMVEDDGADIVWVALGAPKQEIFMSKLKPFLNHGVMIAVGAVFNFLSGLGQDRAPQWMVKRHMEFVYRMFKGPKKHRKHVFDSITILPQILLEEYKRKKAIG